MPGKWRGRATRCGILAAAVLLLLSPFMIYQWWTRYRRVDRQLRVNETLALMAVRYRDPPRFLDATDLSAASMRANPKARPAVRCLLSSHIRSDADDDTANRCMWAWELMGWIGQAEDVEFADAWMQEHEDFVRERWIYAIMMAQNALVIMHHRGVDGAADLLRRMADPDYWRAAGAPEGDPPIIMEMQGGGSALGMIMAFSLHHYLQVESGDMEQVGERAFSGLSDPADAGEPFWRTPGFREAKADYGFLSNGDPPGVMVADLNRLNDACRGVAGMLRAAGCRGAR